jgi:hypothetical protein
MINPTNPAASRMPANMMMAAPAAIKSRTGEDALLLIIGCNQMAISITSI